METKNLIEVDPSIIDRTKGQCVCEECQKPFNPKETLIVHNSNITIHNTGWIKSINVGGKTWYLMSPCCKRVHLTGFDIKPNN